MISTWMVDVIMNPSIGAAMDFLTSDPIPVVHRTGAKLCKTAMPVINFGRKRRTAPSMVASSMSSCLSGTPGSSTRNRHHRIISVEGCLAVVRFCSIADSPIEKTADKTIDLLLPVEFQCRVRRHGIANTFPQVLLRKN
jgi:hypothetical protein